MAKPLTGTCIKTMSRIISDVERQGYNVIAGRPVESGDERPVYAFFATKRHDLYDHMDDCFFKSYINSHGTIIYKPMTCEAFYAGALAN